MYPTPLHLTESWGILADQSRKKNAAKICFYN